MRIIVAGGPRTGKTTFARALAAQTGARLRHTDDLIGHLAWSEASAEVAKWFDEPGPWIVEGVAAGRAVRKWLDAHAFGLPADVVYWGERPVLPRTKAQDAMAKGCTTVWRDIRPQLLARNARVLDLGEPLPALAPPLPPAPPSPR